MAIPGETASEDVTVVVPPNGEGQVIPGFDAFQNVSIQVDDDGSVEIDFDPTPPDEGPSKHDDNLAEKLPESELARISALLLEGIDQDEKDRADWLQQRSDGLDLLGTKVEKPKGSIGASSAPLEGMSVVRDPILLEAVLRFQATAFGELCPAAGPVKVVNYGDNDTETDSLAEDLQEDLNFYLASGVDGTATEYYPDTREMLLWVGYASGMFKKVYKCPIRRRPVSERVDGADLIIPSTATDLRNAQRVTHQINMKRSTMRRMQLLGVYRDVPLHAPTPQPNELDLKKGNMQGLNINNQRQEDQEYTVYECYCELDVAGFEHKEDGEETGLPLPYRVTLDKDSRTILEIRRNWKEDDEDFVAKIPFVAFQYVSGFGVYGMGLLQIMGNVTMALTAMLRETIDAGMFANFPGFLVAKQSTRQLTSEIRVAPGAGAPIETGGQSIRDVAMPLPYKDISPAMVALMQQVRDVGARVGGTAETPVGEGKQDAPVGTTLAMIEQATKIEGGVHKALHAAQAQEFNLLKDLFQEDPESLWRGNRRPKLGQTPQERLQKFQMALEKVDLVPMADPNTPSHMHRVMKALAIKQLQAANPPLYNPVAVDRRILSMIQVDKPEDLFAPPAPPQGPTPEMINAIAQFQLKQNDNAIKAQKMQLDAAKLVIDSKNKEADRKSKETVESMKIAQSLAVHPDANEVVDTQLMQMSQFLNPAGPGGAQAAQAMAPGRSEGGAVVEGMIEPGNIDVSMLPRYPNADGTVSTIRSIGVNIGGREVLLPTIAPGGRIMSPREATELYHRTGNHLGMFESIEAANKFAKTLSGQQGEGHALGGEVQEPEEDKNDMSDIGNMIRMAVKDIPQMMREMQAVQPMPLGVGGSFNPRRWWN